ncbi:decapping and exoribonuclease protein-like [Paramacrobiotus metropolitanus]|uniref:decapping and exoribonuclease protein-like n=1 Tax=Paramacrobiotus metropolitanus TaxID=2943436 RepID=UPI002445F4CD|nr:decapping and exoribonuclease protein-like [Paramacrobiotus metropolitanus]XP_055353438.1 decapping and exoribonuclease protein-like [Paramacrobiotus metropolitanus]XP_055353439.1 decapping and exoribonuclease protein-like [Paramacrobiotus metropolitanus]XP_055353440.1 decapping and exoribonuclease protein-like [Paramacrobiotus metropolitanus]
MAAELPESPNPLSWKIQLDGNIVGIGMALEVGTAASGENPPACPPIVRQHGEGDQSHVTGLEIDLNQGYDPGVEKSWTAVMYRHLMLLLNWMAAHTSYFRDAAPEIVCWNGTLKEIMMTAFNRRTTNANGWKIDVVLIDGVLYMALNGYTHPGNTRKKSEADLEYEKRCEHRGSVYEDVMTRNTGEAATLSHPLKDKSSFYSFLTRRINDIRVMFGAEVDCRDPDVAGTPASYIELKATAHWKATAKTVSQWKWTFYQYKLAKYWAQAFIAGMTKVIVGLWDEAGVLVETREYDTNDIAVQAKAEAMATWNPEEGMVFLGLFLKHVRDTVTKDYKQKVQWGCTRSSGVPTTRTK